MLFTKGAEEKLLGSVNRHNRLVVKAMAHYVAIPDELQSGFGVDGEPTMPTFRDRCSALNRDSDSLFSLYQNLSVAVHPSAATMAQHLNFDADHNIVGVSFGSVRIPPVDTWSGCALAALSAAAAIEVQREGQPRIALLLELGEKYQVPLDLRA